VIRLDGVARRKKPDDAYATMARACEKLGTTTAPLHHEAYCVCWLPADG